MALRQVYDDNGTLKSKDIAGSGSANAADTAYDNSTTGLPANVQGAIDKTTGNISSLGTVELTSTAAHAHAAGSTFLWIGQLVKATAAIAVGDTIAVGTNVENTDICSVLDELDSGLTYINIINDCTFYFTLYPGSSLLYNKSTKHLVGSLLVINGTINNQDALCLLPSYIPCPRELLVGTCDRSYSQDYNFSILPVIRNGNRIVSSHGVDTSIDGTGVFYIINAIL